MATIKKKNLGLQQFGGFTPYGNVTSLRGRLETSATGVVKDSNSTTAPAAGDKIYLTTLPAGFVPTDVQLVVSDAFDATAKIALGFEYLDGVDVAALPQSATHFLPATLIDATGRTVSTVAFPAVPFSKEVVLVATVSVVGLSVAGVLDVIVTGERTGQA